MVNGSDAEIMDWIYQLASINFGVDDWVQDSTELRGILEEYLDKAYTKGKQDVLNDMAANLPEYIDEIYPKGIAKDRGDATVKITLFLLESAKSMGIELGR